MDNEKCKVTLDSPNNTYNSGQLIQGVITLNCTKPKKIRGIYFKITGHGKCSWNNLFVAEKIIQDPSINSSSSLTTSRTSVQSDKKTESAIHLVGDEDYLSEVVYLIGSKNGPSFEVAEGSTNYPFRYQLRYLLPSSFRGTCGKIKYKMEFVVDRPWKFDEKYDVPISITKTVDLSYDPYASVPQQKQITRNIGIFNKGPISLHVLIPQSGYVSGEKMPLQVIINNSSSTYVEKVKFSMRKIVDYYSMYPSRVNKQEIIKILTKEAGGVDKKSEQRYEHMLDIPELQPTDDTASSIINIKYEIRVEAKLSGFFANLVVTVPVTIGTVPLRGNEPQTNPTNLPNQQPIGFISLPETLNNSGITSSIISAREILPPPQETYVPNISSSYPPPLPYPPTNYPSAPPLDFSTVSPNNSTRSSISSQHWEGPPPSYNEIFGSPSHFPMESSSVRNSRRSLNRSSFISLNSSRISSIHQMDNLSLSETSDMGPTPIPPRRQDRRRETPSSTTASDTSAVASPAHAARLNDTAEDNRSQSDQSNIPETVEHFADSQLPSSTDIDLDGTNDSTTAIINQIDNLPSPPRQSPAVSSTTSHRTLVPET